MSWVRKIEGVLDAERRVRGLWAQANAWTCWRTGNEGAGGMVRGAEAGRLPGARALFPLGTQTTASQGHLVVTIIQRLWWFWWFDSL